MDNANDYVFKLHAAIYGDDVPMRHTDWLTDLSRIEPVASRLWPDSTVIEVFCNIASWLEKAGHPEQSQIVWAYIYDNRTIMADSRLRQLSTRLSA